MHRSRVWSDEDGSAAIEFLLVGLVLLVPLVYLVIALGQIQSGAMAADSASRHLARAIATANDDAEAEGRIDDILGSLITQNGWEAESVDMDVRCEPVTPCPAAGALIRVTVTVDVALPLVPAVLDLEDRARVTVEATGVQRVSRGWGGQ